MNQILKQKKKLLHSLIDELPIIPLLFFCWYILRIVLQLFINKTQQYQDICRKFVYLHVSPSQPLSPGYTIRLLPNSLHSLSLTCSH